MKLKFLRTLPDKAPFCYHETEKGIKIFYGAGNLPIEITHEQIAKVVIPFARKNTPVKIGATHGEPQMNTLEKKIREIRNNDTSIASYVAAILVEEGFAIDTGKIGRSHHIKFK